MVIAAVSLSAAVLLMHCAPWALSRFNWQIAYPRVALGTWLGAFVLGFLLTIIAAVSFTLACLDTEDGYSTATLLTLVAWVSVMCIGALIGLVIAMLGRLLERQDYEIRRVASNAVGVEERKGYRLTYFESTSLTAMAVPGALSHIYVSTALRESLTENEFQIILAHERAHLSMRHGLVAKVAEVNYQCLPSLLRARSAFRQAVTLLIELIADDAAAKVFGRDPTAKALLKVAKLSQDASLTLRASRLVQQP